MQAVSQVDMTGDLCSGLTWLPSLIPRISGATYCGEPHMVDSTVPGAKNLERPKSAILMGDLSVLSTISMFSSFKSRCTMPALHELTYVTNTFIACADAYTVSKLDQPQCKNLASYHTLCIFAVIAQQQLKLALMPLMCLHACQPQAGSYGKSRRYKYNASSLGSAFRRSVVRLTAVRVRLCSDDKMLRITISVYWCEHQIEHKHEQEHD